jgi:2-polyprenyl-3-methyl-5-hydroxy-6-metoxy-1,4-benzoquinol methylase
MTDPSSRDFNPIAESLRREVLAFYRERGEEISDASGLTTLDTNSRLAERRAAPLLEILRDHTDLDSIEGLRLLDLGCGFGALSAFFAAQGASVTGVDLKEDRFEVGRAVAAEHGLDAEFRTGLMQDLDLSDRAFDLVVQNNSLCYIVPRGDRHAALSESLRVLRSGGRIVIRNPNRWSARDQFTGIPLLQLLPPNQAVSLANRLGKERSLVRLTSGPEGVRELRRAGFEDVHNVSPPERRWPSFMRPVARYQHLIGRRPR